MERTDYRFTMTRDTDTFEVSPLGFFDGSFKHTRQEGKLFFRREFNGELIFRGNDYNYIKTRYNGGYYCDVFELLIEKKVNGVYETDWAGYFSMSDGKFDFDRCRFYVTPTVEDKYSCIFRNWENEVNIIQGNPTFLNSSVKCNLEFELAKDMGMAKPYYGFLQGMQHFKRAKVLDPNFNTEFILISYRLAVIVPENIVLPSPWIEWDGLDYYSSGGLDYGISIVDKLTPAEGFKKWIIPGNQFSWLSSAYDVMVTDERNPEFDEIDLLEWDPADYYKQGSLKFYYEWTPDYLYMSVDFYVKKTVYNFENWPVTLNYRAWPIMSSLLYLLRNTCDGFESDQVLCPFFTAVNNPVTGETNELLNSYLIQKSDAKRPGASNPATIGKITLKDLLESLYSLFQLSWYIDNDNNLVLAHPIEFENLTDISIVNEPACQHKNGVEFDKSLMFRYEKWTFADAGNTDFIGLPIEYSELCTTKDEDAKTKSYDTPNMSTDLAYIQQNNNVSEYGFVFVTAYNGEIPKGFGILSNRLQLNNKMAISYLHTKYWKHNRILPAGKINGSDVNFLSVQPLRKLTTQEFVYCGTVDPMKKVVTQLGNATINEAEFFPFDKRLVLNMSI